MLTLLSALLAPASLAASPSLPPAPTRAAIVRELAREMERVDGEGLIVREGRPSTFASITSLLAQEAERAADWPDFLRALERLDEAYPNLHARFEPGDSLPSPSRVLPVARFVGEWLTPGHTLLRISRVDAGAFPADVAPEPGDLLVAINGEPTEEWTLRHFDFCKWALRAQCDLRFPSDFYQEHAGWTRAASLRYTLERGDRRWTVNVPVRERAREASPSRREDELLCASQPNRYPGFRLAHAGRYACFFERIDDPGTRLLRITSFYYEQSLAATPGSVEEEVNAFAPYWRAHAAQTRHLVIDLADNGGGNQTTPYYAEFFERPYQEQWVRFKKIAELDDPVLRESMFWGTPEQELWFQNLKQEGTWGATAYGDFLPPVPMFCAREGRDCREGLFPVQGTGFRGVVSLLVNPRCVSSCDGFAFAFQEQLGARVQLFGQPQAADTAYSRIRIGVSLDGPRGFTLRMLPQYGEPPAGVVFSQIASVTRSVDARGEVKSGRPLPLARFVPATYDNADRWIQDALAAALAREP